MTVTLEGDKNEGDCREKKCFNSTPLWMLNSNSD